MSKKIPTRYQEQRDRARQWLTTGDGQKFSAWWRTHRHSGYATKGAETRWTIRPWEATLDDRYMAEFYSCHPEITGTPRYEYDAEDYEAWAREQRDVEAMTQKLEARFGPMSEMTPQQWIANAKIVAHEVAGDLTKANQAKIEEAYAPIPGQSEEETALLARRREA